MRTKWQVLTLAVTISGVGIGGHRAAAATAPAKDDAPKAAAKPQSPEQQPSSPEDEALKRLLGKRTSTKRIALSSGPATRPHTVLGTVNVEAPAQHTGASSNAGPNLYLNELLRAEAVKRYGESAVDGIVSITYAPPADGKQSASGVAVHFEEPAGGKPK
jgi:hypothetical protein